MLRLDDNKYFSQNLIYFFWLLMSFQAGYVNVGGFFTSGSFVSHVTGTSSRIGMGIANFDLVVLATFVTILLAFIFGAAFAGHYVGSMKELGKEPKYTRVLFIKSFFFGTVLYLSSITIGHDFFLSQNMVNFFIIFMLSFCCGVQNATCALSTKGFLKPTHMTGLSTDVGINMAKLFSLKVTDPKKYKEEKRSHFLRISILISFIFGGIVATMIFSANGHYGFLFPFISSVCFLAMGIARDIKKNAHESWTFKTAKGSIFITFLTTLLFGFNAFLNI